MAKKIALLFAGQGAQVVGMGKDLADEFPTAADLFTGSLVYRSCASWVAIFRLEEQLVCR
jgi:malonyl CoA-acyl carrier protein transacylase